jgi:exopolysaccharide biosynthesis polyprenyl glycosylphosphotransferase
MSRTPQGEAKATAPIALLDRSRTRPAPASAPSGLEATDRGVRLRRALLLADLTAVFLTVGLATLVVSVGGEAIAAWDHFLAILICLPAFVLLAQSLGLYHLMERNVDYTLAEELGPTFMVATAWTWILVLVTAVVVQEPVELVWFATFWVLLVVTVLGGRAIVRAVTRSRPWYRQKVMLIGDPNGVAQVARRIDRHPETGLDPIAAIYRTANGLMTLYHHDNGRGNDLGSIEDLTPQAVRELLGRAGVQRVVVTGWGEDLDERTELIRVLVTSGIYVDLVSGEPEALSSGASIHHIEGLPIMTISPTRMTRAGRAAKRVMDVLVAAVGLAALAPLLAYVAIRIKLDSPGPVLFRHPRIGRDGRPFEMLKFRTMVEGAERMREALRDESVERELFKLRDDPRLTAFGKKLRFRSIDELPQLWNVLRGEMSLVGPRPLPLDEAPLAADHFAERARVRPGITGPWQIHGRSDIPFDDMVKLDYTYVSSWSLEEDLRLLIRTVGVVVSGRGAY